MSKTPATDFARKKAFELGYALFRAAAIAKSRSFAETLETKATALLDSVVSQDYETARATIKHIEYFIRFGTDAGLLHLHNAEIIIKEGSILYAAIAGLPEPAILQELNFDKFFSKSPLQDKTSVSATISAKPVKVPAKPELQEVDESNPAKSAVRQSAIMDRLRQTENLPDDKAGCRFAELQELLPEVSERTLRYDLQSLADRGFIEKVGGKPGFYRSKTELLPAMELQGVPSPASL